MVEVAPITILDMIMQKGLKLIYVDTKKGGGQGAPLFDPNGTFDKVRHPMCSAETTKNRLVQVHNGNQECLLWIK
jgi:hypothetical protein